MINSDLFTFSVSILSLIIVTAFHEFAHAYTAHIFGDPTPKYQGRVTLNPVKHIDPIGLLMIFLIGFGWGKPVEINPLYFKNPKNHEAIVAIAGPMMNFLIAIICITILKYAQPIISPELTFILNSLSSISILLLAFNILPFPPLDGSKFVQILLPNRYQDQYSRYLANGTMYFIAFLLIDNFILQRYFNYSIIFSAIQIITKFVYSIIYFGS